jgi:two-component system CheB/CheR fusion protein
MISAMPPPGGGRHTYAPPVDRDARWIRVAAAILGLLVFWLDTATPIGVADPVLYVAPILLFMQAGRYWEPIIAAALATPLLIIGAWASPPGHLDLLFVNRPLELLVVWFTAGLVAYHRSSMERWTAHFADERSAREHSIHRLEEIRQALDQAAIVATTDQRGIITYANDKFCEISGYSREELLGQDHRIVNSGYHTKEFFRDLWHTIARGQVWRGEIRNRARDGHHYWVDTTIVPFLDAQEKPRQYLAIRSDITQRKAAEAKLLEQSSLAQLGQLAAVVAHEVRNPLAGVRGALQVLRSRSGVGTEDRGLMDAMIARIDVLNAKVEDILRFARPRAPVVEDVDVRIVALDAIQSARAAAGQECSEIVAPANSVIIQGDREMLRDILLNLILNACQAGGRAPVEVSVVPMGRMCRIDIADRGPGIKQEHSEKIFDAFYTTKKSGTGLGLAIVRRLVTLQDGSIVLLVREGGGTIARVEMPLAVAVAASVPAGR